VRLTTRALIKIAPRFVCSSDRRRVYSFTARGTESCFTPSLQKVIPCSRDRVTMGPFPARWGRPLFRSLALFASSQQLAILYNEKVATGENKK